MKPLTRIPEPLFVYTVFLLFFLCTLASNFSGPHDAIAYLNGMVEGKYLFHQHHLLYHYITHHWLYATKALFPSVPDHYLAETFTALWGSGSMAVVYSFLRKRFGLSVVQSLLGTCIAAFSYGAWFYSTNVEVYAPPMFLLLLALYVLTRSNLSRGDIITGALLHSAAVLFHQVHILFTITMLYVLWRQRQKVRFRIAFLQYAAMGTVLVGGAYFVVGWIIEGQNSWGSWINWIQGYAGGDAYWRPVSYETPLHVAMGFSHAFIGGHYIFRLPLVPDWLNQLSGERSLNDEAFLVRDMSESMAVLLAVITLLLVVFMIALAIRFIRRYRQLKQQQSALMMPVLVTFVVYSLFFCFWEPEILEFWIFQSLLFWILVLGAAAADTQSLFKLKSVQWTALIAGCLLVVNYFGSVRYLLHLENDLYYVRSLPLKGEARATDAVLLQDGWILKDFLDYYTPATIWQSPVSSAERAAMDSSITAHVQQGGRLFIYPESRNGKKQGDTRYIDSLVRAHSGNTSIFHQTNPEVLVIQ
jgi:hypothetical protein